MMMGSIELARTICEEIKGKLPEGEQYGSVDVAEILSAHVRNLENSVEVAKSVTSKLEAQRDALKREYVNRCPHEWYQGRCVHCDVQAKDGKPAI